MANSRFPALQFRNYRIFWFGQFVSLIGTWMQSTVQPYLAYQLTDQPIYLGLVGFANTLPAFLFILPAGVIIERLNKRKTVIIMQIVMMLQAFTLAYLAITHQVTIWHIVGLTFILGFANSLEITARQSMLIELVDREALPNAIALNSTIFNAARVIGPSLSAPFLMLLQNTGEGWAFFANGVSYLFVIIGLFIIQTKPKQLAENNHRLSTADFLEGQKFIRSTPIILFILMLVAIPSFWGFPFAQQIPVFSRDVLKAVGDTNAIVAGRNSLMVTTQGVGALIAAVTLAAFSTMRHKGRLLMVGQIVFALGLVGLGFSRSLYQAVPFILMMGWGTVTQLALANTLIQLTVPDHLRGRVISSYLWVMNGIAPFGSLFLGWLVQTVGASTAVMIGGSVCLVGYLGFHYLRPEIRRLVNS